MEEILCPIEYSIVAQIVIAITIGIILSCFYVSALAILVFLIFYEALLFFNSGSRWNATIRIAVICAYIFGWILGRTVYEMNSCVVSKEFDEEYGI